MKKVLALPANKPKTIASRNVAWMLAAILVLMAVGQLFSFEKFLPLIEDYWLPGGHGMAMLVACLIVICEVFALPFLLRMRLSPLMRWFSMACCIIAVMLWVSLGSIAVFSNTVMTNSGMFGTRIVMLSGATQLAVAIALAGMVAWAVWGLWPVRRK